VGKWLGRINVRSSWQAVRCSGEYCSDRRFPDKNHQRAGQSGVRWFERLGARHVTLLPLIDQASANQFSVASALRQSRLIYLLGGFPHYLAQTLAGSLSWQAMLEAYDTGAVIGAAVRGP